MAKEFDLQVFNKQTYTAMTELIAQDIEAFNESSGGAITLVNEPFEGDFDIRTKFQEISGLVRRRDVYGQGAVDSKRLKQMLEVAVKVAAGTAPIEFEAAQYNWIQQNPEVAAYTIGAQLAKGRMADMLNTAIQSAVTAIGSNDDVVTDLSDEAPSFAGLVKGQSKFGDRAGAIRAWVTHSAVLHGLYLNAVTNMERLFTYDSVNVIRDPFGRILVTTDSPALVNEDAYAVLGLVEGGLRVTNNADFDALLERRTGKENLKSIYQAEWTYGVSVKGYSWNTAVQSPNDDDLADSANWDINATSHKDTAGVLVLMGDMGK